jgi:hypothetical protein
MDEFDRGWRQKFEERIEVEAGAEALDKIHLQIDGDNSGSGEGDVIDWTRSAMSRLEQTLDAQTCRDIMTGCACHYPPHQLEPLQSLYLHTGDITQVHAALQRQFKDFLRETLQLNEDAIEDVVGRGWGAAGLLDGDRIIATKIPKSGYLKKYLSEADADVRRSYYCHCPRVRHAVEAGERLPMVYCFCGAGYYKHMWETILQDEVRVDVLESVLSGGEVCKILIRLPNSA